MSDLLEELPKEHCLEGNCPICNKPKRTEGGKRGVWVSLGRGLEHLAHLTCWSSKTPEELEEIRTKLGVERERVF